jgi:hypothetical protein
MTYPVNEAEQAIEYSIPSPQECTPRTAEFAGLRQFCVLQVFPGAMSLVAGRSALNWAAT